MTAQNPQTQKIARSFSYTSAPLLIGALFYLLTNQFVGITEQRGFLGTGFLIGFALIYGNITFVFSRRYMRKVQSFDFYPYVIGFLLVFPAILLTQLKEDVFYSAAGAVFFYAAILAAVMLGAYRGTKKGLIQRKEEAENRKKKMN